MQKGTSKQPQRRKKAPNQHARYHKHPYSSFIPRELHQRIRRRYPTKIEFWNFVDRVSTRCHQRCGQEATLWQIAPAVDKVLQHPGVHTHTQAQFEDDVISFISKEIKNERKRQFKVDEVQSTARGKISPHSMVFPSEHQIIDT